MKVVERNEQQLLLMVSSKSYRYIGLLLFALGLWAIYLVGPKISVVCQEKFPGISKQCHLRHVYLGLFTSHIEKFDQIKQLESTPQGLTIISPKTTFILGQSLIPATMQDDAYTALKSYHDFEGKKSVTLPSHSAAWEQGLLLYLVLVSLSGMVFIGHAYIFLDKKSNRLTYAYRQLFSRKETQCELDQVTAIEGVPGRGGVLQLQLAVKESAPFLLLKNVPVSKREKLKLAATIADFLTIDNRTIDKPVMNEK